MNLNREMRGSASAAFAYFLGADSTSTVVEEVLVGDAESHITLKSGN